MTTPLTLDMIRQAPKALLHDHLDGGLRPATVVELAAETGYDELPATDVDELATWFRTQAHSGSLVRYLEPFAHTVGVMQTPEALYRVAFECAEDLAADSVVYAEVRFAPELHIDGGLSLDEVVDAVLAGFADGEKAANAARVTRSPCAAWSPRCATPPGHGRSPSWRSASATRASSDSTSPAPRRAILRRATSTRSNTCGTTTRASPFTRARRSGCRRFTRPSRSAVPTGSGTACGSSTTSRSAGRRGATLGRLASILRDKRIPLELCPSSNVQTGAVASIAEHPFDLLARLRFRVTVNTDNRLMSDTTMSQEMLRLVEAFGYGWSDLERFTINAMKSVVHPVPRTTGPHRRRDQAALRRAHRLTDVFVAFVEAFREWSPQQRNGLRWEIGYQPSALAAVTDERP